MNHAIAADESRQTLEPFELIIATLIFGSILGTIGYFFATNQRYGVGDEGAFANPLTWIGVAGRLLFSFASRVPLARLGWRLGVALAVITFVTPLGGRGVLPWVGRAVGTATWSGLVAFAAGRAVSKKWRIVAVLVLLGEIALRYWSLQNWDRVRGRTTVLWGD